MDTFSIITNALAASENDPDKAGLDRGTIETGRILMAVQTVVDALTPPDGGRYVVGFADIGTAATSLGERRITVSSKPLSDQSLSMVEKAVVIATFAAHEIGHTMVTRPRGGIAREHNVHSGYHAVANLADDIILEPFMTDRFPILEDAFEFTGLWVLRTTAESLPKVLQMKASMTTAERFNVVLNATRYGDIADIIWLDAVTRSERDWSRDWAQRLIALRLRDGAGYLALLDEVWERIRSTAPEEQPEDDDEPESDEDEGEDEPEADDDEQDESDEDDDGQPGDEQGEDEADDDETEPGDEQGDEPSDEQGEDEGEGGSEEADDDEQDPDGQGDEPGTESEGGDEATERGDEPTQGKGKGESIPGEQDQSPDWDDGTKDDGHIKGDKPREEAQGGGGNAEATFRDENDFDSNEVEKSMHEQSTRDPRDWSGTDRANEDKVRTYTSSTVTAFGRHGTMPTVWD